MSEIRVENIIGETGTDAVKFTKGVNVTGIATATNVSVASSVTASTFHGSGANLTGISAGLPMLDVWTVTSDVSITSSSSFITSWSRANSYQATIGSAMTESSGVFTFPSTGIYEVMFSPQFNESDSSSNRYVTTQIYKVISGSSSLFAESVSHISGLSGNTYARPIAHAYFDVTDVSTHKMQFKALSINGTIILSGHSSSFLYTTLTFKKLGET